MKKDISYIFNPEKNAQLKKNRGVSFEDVIYSISNDKVLDILTHHNNRVYPNQWIMVVEINDYAYQVPFKYEGNNIRLITVFPSRKCTKKYLGGKENV